MFKYKKNGFVGLMKNPHTIFYYQANSHPPLQNYGVAQAGSV